MQNAILLKTKAAFERAFPEQRLFLRSEKETRFIRLTPMTQFVALTGSALVAGWAIIASALLLMDSLSAGNLREQATREQNLYEDRLNLLSADRDIYLREAENAEARFAAALQEVSAMQTRLLASETRRRELETGIEITQATLKRTMQERDAARAEAEQLEIRLAEETAADSDSDSTLADTTQTLKFLSGALSAAAAERDGMVQFVEEAETKLAEMAFEAELEDERAQRIFSQIEEAAQSSLEPIDEMFRSVGLPTDAILDQIRRNYTGQGGPLTPLTLSTRNTRDSEDTRAFEVMELLDELNVYRIAAERTPFAMPVSVPYRLTSKFGPRWGRMHNGSDMAAPHGTDIFATADGVVSFAGWQTGFGQLIKIQHDFGTETYFAHLSNIRVKTGQRVSRGDHIGDMGNTGRSTGSHLHYEIRVGGKPLDPMKYIEAARDVF